VRYCDVYVLTVCRDKLPNENLTLVRSVILLSNVDKNVLLRASIMMFLPKIKEKDINQYIIRVIQVR